MKLYNEAAELLMHLIEKLADQFMIELKGDHIRGIYFWKRKQQLLFEDAFCDSYILWQNENSGSPTEIKMYFLVYRPKGAPLRDQTVQIIPYYLSLDHSCQVAGEGLAFSINRGIVCAVYAKQMECQVQFANDWLKGIYFSYMQH